VPPLELMPTFVTAVNTWQCDENDHLNVQYYTEFAHDAAAELLHRLGLGPRVQRAMRPVVRVKEDHIRYLREFRIVDSVEVRSAPVAIGEQDLVVYHEVRNPADGTLAATIRQRIVNSTRWQDRFRARVEAATVEMPAEAQPRSVGTPPLPWVTLANAERIGLITVGRSVIKPAECDERGDLLPRHLFLRYSDAAPMLWNHLGFDRAAMQERGEGTVVVETLQTFGAPLKAGNLLVVMSGLSDFSDKTLKLVHFAYEAESGTLCARAEGIALKFDQKARKVMPFSADDRARLAARRARLFEKA
jgi:acyl-CoA thioester hydrolase